MLLFQCLLLLQCRLVIIISSLTSRVIKDSKSANCLFELDLDKLLLLLLLLSVSLTLDMIPDIY